MTISLFQMNHFTTNPFAGVSQGAQVSSSVLDISIKDPESSNALQITNQPEPIEFSIPVVLLPLPDQKNLLNGSYVTIKMNLNRTDSALLYNTIVNATADLSDVSYLISFDGCPNATVANTSVSEGAARNISGTVWMVTLSAAELLTMAEENGYDGDNLTVCIGVVVYIDQGRATRWPSHGRFIHYNSNTGRPHFVVTQILIKWSIQSLYYCRPFNQWQRSFQMKAVLPLGKRLATAWKLCSYWLKGLQQRHVSCRIFPNLVHSVQLKNTFRCISSSWS